MKASLVCRRCRSAAVILLALAGLAGSPDMVRAGLLLQDDFNDNWLDGTKWTTNTSIPAGNASVTEVDQHIELANRGHLVTASQFDPTALPGGITITGQWTFAVTGGDDYFQALTRSDGVADAKYGNCLNGIMFYVNATGESESLHISAKGLDLAVADVATSGTVSIDSGDMFDFRIVDNGTNVSFTMTEVGNSSNTASATATVTKDTFALNYVVFYNREYVDPFNHIAYLDNVLIATVPEPSTLSLMAMGLAGLAMVRRRRA